MWLKADRVELNDITAHDVPQNFYKEIQGMKIAYKDIGSGPIVFCVPPWPSGSAAFVPLAMALKDHVRIIALDLPGWGGRSDKMQLEPTVNNYTKLISEFVQSFGFKEYSLLGYSFGGVFCQEILSHFEVMPQKIVFVSTIHSGKELQADHKRELAMYKVARKLWIPQFIIKRIVAAFILADHRRKRSTRAYTSSWLFKQIVKENMRANIDVIFATMFSLFHEREIKQLQTPVQTLVLYADGDPIYMRTESQAMAQSFGVEPVVMTDTDHDHFTFNVNKSSDIILNFLLA